MTEEKDNVIYPKAFAKNKIKLLIKTHTPAGIIESEATIADVWIHMNDKMSHELYKLERKFSRRTWAHKVSELFVLASFLGNFAVGWYFFAKHVLGWNI